MGLLFRKTEGVKNPFHRHQRPLQEIRLNTVEALVKTHAISISVHVKVSADVLGDMDIGGKLTAVVSYRRRAQWNHLPRLAINQDSPLRRVGLKLQYLTTPVLDQVEKIEDVKTEEDHADGIWIPLPLSKRAEIKSVLRGGLRLGSR
jgi:hypothetical protein